MELFSQAKCQALKIIMSVRCICDVSAPGFTLLQGLENASKDRVLGWLLVARSSWVVWSSWGCFTVWWMQGGFSGLFLPAF